MIYPRLRLAKDLLADDGAIFVSIDEHEHENLIHIMNEIFGESNYIDSIVWDKKGSAKRRGSVRKHLCERIGVV